jgi:hypothetical protein
MTGIPSNDEAGAPTGTAGTTGLQNPRNAQG